MSGPVVGVGSAATGLAASVPATAWGAAVAVGLALGLLGSGGSMLAVPLLHALVGLPFGEARATSYPVVGGVALAGLLAHARAGTVRLAPALPFAVGSVAASFLAARYVAPWVPERAAALGFAALLGVAALRMARARPVAALPVVRRPARVALAGAGVGGLTGLLGVGGGFLVVPALVGGLGLGVREAVGTSLLVVVLNTAAALVATLAAGEGAAVHGDLALVLGGVGAAGALVGARAAARVGAAALRRLFAAVLVALAAWLVLAVVR